MRATADWIAFLDDDEPPTGLAGACSPSRGEPCDAVLARWTRSIRPRPALDPAPWTPTRRGRSSPRRDPQGLCRQRHAAPRDGGAAGLRFDPALGRSGGEDDRFFYDLTDAAA
jgi:succinoglycan biosynthesis protein ExoM